METALLILITFLAAGVIKGATGMGLPIFSLAILALRMPMESAMAIIALPSLVTNLWQALAGGYLRTLLRKLWPFLTLAMIMTWLAIAARGAIDSALLLRLLGVLLCVHALITLTAPHWRVAERYIPWLNPLMGALTGAATGLAGAAIFPSAPYLQAMGLGKEAFVQALALLFGLLAIVMGAALTAHNYMGRELAILSVWAVPPALIGLALGGKIRARLSEQRFRQAVLGMLLILGANLLLRSA
ncbi:sulfite exporter TauE/SafE family protein [Magnetofaba australis]|uniref:Probable membrane transporter protein n=1 Tax=Magnetofaba australis IT-1 TaxID=1434232 RepID=A0A1Y2K2Z8_9PROT|nr:sulfite exporter TauE/SafE family protein [Magnetofaba australis]OSM02430.1 putative permease [Magnetofaba australis IT-1]